MAKTRLSCPNCRQPVVVEVEQLFDVEQDPAAKQRLLSGDVNMIRCQVCGYQGSASVPVVFHDPAKELLLTYMPPELGLPMNEQERLLGGLINQVVKNLPQEKRKAYLFRPQPMFTLQSMLERVLEGDGITRDMIQAQQQRLGLIQRLASASSADVQIEIARQEDALIDAEFFTLLRRLAEASAASGDQESTRQLEMVQNVVLQETKFGQELLSQSKEVQSAVQDLQALGENLTRDNLLDLMINAPNEVRLQALVSLTRPALDYSFFQLLSDRVDRSRGDGRARLVTLRSSLLEMTSEIDKQVEARRTQARQLLESILQAADPQNELMQNLQALDDYFMQELTDVQEAARGQGDLEKISKIQLIVDMLKQLSQQPPEVELIQQLLEVPEGPQQETTWREMLQENQELVTSDFIDALSGFAAQIQDSGDDVLAPRAAALNRLAIRFSMEQQMRG